MSKQFSFCYQAPPVGLLPPAADSAGRTGPYKSLRNVSGKVAVVCRINQGAATPIQFSILQAKDSSGTGSKAINAVPIFYNADTTASDTLSGQTAAANFTTDAATKDKIVVFEFEPADGLDLANGFNHIAVETGASAAGNVTSAHMEAIGRYQGATPPASEV